MRSVLVFSPHQHGAVSAVAHRLEKSGYPAEVLHSNRTQRERTEAMDNFKAGKSQILVATDIAARGIDVKDISHVINYDVPQHPEDYVHRVGRTARAYGVGDALTLMDPLEQVHVTDIERFTNLVFPRAVVPNFPYKIAPKLEAPKTSHKTAWDRVSPNGRATPPIPAAPPVIAKKKKITSEIYNWFEFGYSPQGQFTPRGNAEWRKTQPQAPAKRLRTLSPTPTLSRRLTSTVPMKRPTVAINPFNKWWWTWA
ncbi:MAG: DEAD/DEAH box helicase [Elusimicrobia bacterium]|nr:DEAD/DEAH box helicase [Elusimicrobiota bacterium]